MENSKYRTKYAERTTGFNVQLKKRGMANFIASQLKDEIMAKKLSKDYIENR